MAEGLPRDAEKIVRRCLRKDPEHRFHRMEDLRVALEELKEESDSGKLETTDAAKPKPRRRFVWTFGVVVALAIATVGVWFFRSRVGTQEAPLTLVPLTSYAGIEYGASFSPDGNRVAFGWNGEKEDNWDIYIKLVGSEPPFRLTTNKADERWPAWSLDSRAMAVVEAASAGVFACLVLYMVETGEKHPMTKSTKNVPTDSCPTFSPDGRTLAFSRWVDLNICDLYLLNLSSDLKPVGDPRRLTFQNLHIEGSAWVSDGNALVYSAGGNLWTVAASGSSQPQKLASVGQGVYSPAISHRAARLAYTHSTFDTNIWRVELSSSQRKTNPPMKFISSTQNEWSPQYSPDGKKISFTSERPGGDELWICDADGSNPIQLTHFGKGFVTDPRWSPDGGRLTFYSSVEGHSEVYVISAGGGKPRRLTLTAGSTDAGWSRDGRRLQG